MAYKVNPNLELSIYFDNDYFVTGEFLKGTLELNVEDEYNLRLREIWVELTGFEEINFQKANASKVFFSTKIYFQGPRIKPSTAVRGLPEYDGFWRAVKGKTLFNFSFKLPQSAPSSFSLLNNDASVKYVVTGNVQYHQDNVYDSLYTSEEALVLENIDQDSISSIPVRASTQKKKVLGRGSSIKLEAIASQSYFCSGRNAQIEVHVVNDTKHKINGLKAVLYRSIIIPGTVTKKDNKSIINSISDINLKSRDYVFNANEEKSVYIQIPIPENNISMKNTSLFIVQYYITLSINHGMFSKNISINLPISICHSKLYNFINYYSKPKQEINKYTKNKPSDLLSHKKTFFNNLRSLSRKASLLRSKTLISKLCISDNDDYSKEKPKRRGSSRLSEVKLPSNFETIKLQNDLHMKNSKNMEGIDYYYNKQNNNENLSIDASTEINNYGSSVYNSTYYTDFNSDNAETEQDISNQTSNSYSCDETNINNSYGQNDDVNNSNDMDEDFSDSDIIETENEYSSDIDKFSKYFSNKKVFRSLSTENTNTSKNNSYDNGCSNNSNNNFNSNKSSLTYSNTYNFGNNYKRPKTYDSMSVKSKDSGKHSFKNLSLGEIRLSNSYNKNNSSPSVPIKPKISSSNLKKVTSIETGNDEDENSDSDYANTTVYKSLSSPYMQPNESNYISSLPSNSNTSRVLNNSRNNLNIQNNEYRNNCHDNINNTFDGSFNETPENENSFRSQGKSLVLTSNYTGRTLNRNNSFQSNSSFRKAEPDTSSISSITSPYSKYSGNVSNNNNRSFENNRNESYHSPYHNNKSSPLHNTSQSSSFHKNYYNEVNMNNITFTQNRSINNSSTSISSPKNNNNNNNSFSNNSFSNNSFTYQSPRSLSSTPSPPFNKIHFNGNSGHNFGPSSPMTPNIKHKFSNSSKNSYHSVDGYLKRNNSRGSNHNTTSKNNHKYETGYTKQAISSPIPLQVKSKTEKYSINKSSSYSTPPPINPSSPYSVPTLSSYINQFQRRPSLKYY